MSANLHQKWLERGAEDLIVAGLVHGEQHYTHACFLSQQCLEKTLKAFLIARTNQYPRTHKLVDLLQQCMVVEPKFAQFFAACVAIDQYYIPTRYPDATPGGLPSGLPSAAQAQKAIDAATEISQFVTSLLA